jgi:hypothetical protein
MAQMKSNLAEPLLADNEVELDELSPLGGHASRSKQPEFSMNLSGLGRESLHEPISIPMLSPRKRARNRKPMSVRALNTLVRKPMHYLVQDGSQGKALRLGIVLFTIGQLMSGAGYFVGRHFYRRSSWPSVLLLLSAIFRSCGLISMARADLDIDLYVRRNKKLLLWLIICVMIQELSKAVYHSYFFLVALIPTAYLLVRFEKIVNEAGFRHDPKHVTLVTTTESFSRWWVLTFVTLCFSWAFADLWWAFNGSPSTVGWELENFPGQHRNLYIVLAMLRFAGGISMEMTYRVATAEGGSRTFGMYLTMYVFLAITGVDK